MICYVDYVHIELTRRIYIYIYIYIYIIYSQIKMICWDLLTLSKSYRRTVTRTLMNGQIVDLIPELMGLISW